MTGIIGTKHSKEATMNTEATATEAAEVVDPAVSTERIESADAQATGAEGAKTEEQIKAENIAKSKAGTDPETQRKLDKLTWEKNEAKREAERIKIELDAVKSKPVEIHPPDPANFKDGEFDPGYRHALIEYGKKSGESEIATRIRQENEAAIAKQRQESAINSFEDRANKMRAEAPDFDAVAKAPEMVQLYSHPKMQPVVEALYDSEVGPQIAYYLGKNPGEAYRLANMPWPSALREVGRLEAKILVEAKPKKISVASEPINALEGSGPASTDKDPASMSPEEFAKWRNSYKSKRR